jgi:hypothetical protein
MQPRSGEGRLLGEVAVAKETPENRLDGCELRRGRREEAALENEGGEEEGAGNMDAFKEARVEGGPGCCFAEEGSWLVAEGGDLHLLVRRGDRHP